MAAIPKVEALSSPLVLGLCSTETGPGPFQCGISLPAPPGRKTRLPTGAVKRCLPVRIDQRRAALCPVGREGATLQKATHATFARRQTAPVGQRPYPLTDDLAEDAGIQTQWVAFLCSNGLTGSPLNFPDVVAARRRFFGPDLLSERNVQQVESSERLATLTALLNPLFN